MSSRDRMRLAGLGLVLVAAALSGGCFRPLYAESTLSKTGSSVRETLRGIDVAPVPGVMGHYLRNELVFDLDGGGQAAAKPLVLNVSVTESLDVTVVNYTTGRADSATLVATATWSVADKAGKVVTNGTSVARSTYDRSTQRFATIRAAREAQIRAAKSLSELIRNRIAADLVAAG